MQMSDQIKKLRFKCDCYSNGSVWGRGLISLNGVGSYAGTKFLFVIVILLVRAVAVHC